MRGLSPVAASGGHSSFTVRGPLTIAASLVAEHRLQTRRLSNCGSRAQLLRSMWDPPRPGLEPVSPALAGRPSTTAPPGKPWPYIFLKSKETRKELKHINSWLLKDFSFLSVLFLRFIVFLLNKKHQGNEEKYTELQEICTKTLELEAC